MREKSIRMPRQVEGLGELSSDLPARCRAPSPDQEFRAATVVYGMMEAPQDGTPIIGRDRAGNVALIRWRIHPELDEEEDDPYWARVETDELFEPIVWIPTIDTLDAPYVEQVRRFRHG